MYLKLKIVPPVSEGLNLGMSHVPSHNWHFWIFVCPCNDFYHNHLTLKKHHLPNAGIRNPWTLACVQTNPWILRFCKICHRLKYTSTPPKKNHMLNYITSMFVTLVNTQHVPTVKGFSWENPMKLITCGATSPHQPQPLSTHPLEVHVFLWLAVGHLPGQIREILSSLDIQGIWTPKNTPNLRRYLDF